MADRRPGAGACVAVAACLLLAGCDTFNLSSRGLIDAGAAAGAGLAANKITNGDSTATVAAAAGAGIAADVLQGAYNKETAKKVTASYDLGRSDATKQLYWATQRLQAPGGGGEQAKYSEYPVQLPEQTVDGVIYQPTTKTLRINE